MYFHEYPCEFPYIFLIIQLTFDDHLIFAPEHNMKFCKPPGTGNSWGIQINIIELVLNAPSAIGGLLRHINDTQSVFYWKLQCTEFIASECLQVSARPCDNSSFQVFCFMIFRTTNLVVFYIMIKLLSELCFSDQTPWHNEKFWDRTIHLKNIHLTPFDIETSYCHGRVIGLDQG